MIAALRGAGYKVEVCKGFEAAREVLQDYMLNICEEDAA
jgi:hypothetical protein